MKTEILLECDAASGLPKGHRPPHLMQALADVRASGQCNMLNPACVIIALDDTGFTYQADWLKAHLNNYFEVMQEFSHWLQDNPLPPKESLAQRVARETGLEVVEE